MDTFLGLALEKTPAQVDKGATQSADKGEGVAVMEIDGTRRFLNEMALSEHIDSARQQGHAAQAWLYIKVLQTLQDAKTLGTDFGKPLVSPAEFQLPSAPATTNGVGNRPRAGDLPAPRP